MSYGATGYIALHRSDIQRDQVRVLALRHPARLSTLIAPRFPSCEAKR
jgi:hypothetical protein